MEDYLINSTLLNLKILNPLRRERELIRTYPDY
jgi:hypothetical protein